MLKIHVPVAALKTALTGLSKIIARRATLPVLGCVRFTSIDSGVHASGTDLDSHLTTTLDGARAEGTGSLLAPLTLLTHIAKRCPSGSDLLVEPRTIAYPVGGGAIARQTFDEIDPQEFPDAPEIKTQPLALPPTFGVRLQEALRCASDDPTRYVLNGACLDGSGSGDTGHYLVGTNGRHLFAANGLTLPGGGQFIVPTTKFLTSPAFVGDGPWTLGLIQGEDRGFVVITGSRWIYTVKLIEGNYPNWRQVVPAVSDQKTVVTVPAARLMELQRTVAALPGGDHENKPVILVVRDRKFLIQGGDTQVPVADAEVRGPAIEVGLNREFLTKAFAFSLTRIGMIDPMAPVHFSCEGRVLVAMPLRIAESVPTPAPEPEPEVAQDTTQTAESITEPAQPKEPMPINGTPTTPAPVNGNGQHHTNGDTARTPTGSALELAIDLAEKTRVELRAAASNLTDLVSRLREAQRERRTNQREVETARQTLAQLQKVRL